MIKAKCEYCETEFEKKNAWHKFCKRGCNRSAYRERKGLPEPDFPSMKADSLVERERQIRKKEDSEILELVEQLKELEVIRSYRQAEDDKPMKWKLGRYYSTGSQLFIAITQGLSLIHI